MEELDSMVHNIYQEVSSQIDCTKCANCCKEMKPVLDIEDIKRFSTGIDILFKEFKNQHIEIGEDKNEFYFNKKPCPFLKDNLCKNYDFRPDDCRSFPHLDKEEFVTRLWDVVDNYSICPIVFNVYEILKNKLWQYLMIMTFMMIMMHFKGYLTTASSRRLYSWHEFTFCARPRRCLCLAVEIVE